MDVVSARSQITFGNNAETFDLPEPLLINPALIHDETEGVYRLSIGVINGSSSNEAADTYQRLFDILEQQMPFVENMHISVGDATLTFKLAYVMKSEKPFGTFFDIEATDKEIKYIEKKGTINAGFES